MRTFEALVLGHFMTKETRNRSKRVSFFEAIGKCTKRNRIDASLSILFLLLRMAVSQMDVPARQAYVMAVVPPEERTAASSVTNVPRSLAAGAGLQEGVERS